MTVIDDFEAAAHSFAECARAGRGLIHNDDPAQAALWARLWFAQVVDITLSDRFMVLLIDLKSDEAPESSLTESRGDTALAAGGADIATSDAKGRAQTAAPVSEEVESAASPDSLDSTSSDLTSVERGIWWDPTGVVETVPDGA